MAILPQTGEPGYVRVCEAVTGFVEQRERSIVLRGAFVPTIQLGPYLEAKPAKVAADGSGMSVASFQFTSFDKAIAHYALDGVAGRSDP